jgi:type IV pilus assembly protein PilN
MYSLDINFLKDRAAAQADGARRGGRGRPRTVVSDDKRPLYWGLAALAILPLLMLGTWFFLGNQKESLSQQQAELDRKLGNLEAEKRRLAAIQTEIKQSTDETQALATVFNQIKPWSAMAQDIRDRLPANVQLLTIKQIDATAVGAPAAKPAAAAPAGAQQPPVSGLVEISGLANTHSDVNDFLLTLKQSNFLKGDQTQLMSSELGEEGTLASLDFARPGSGSGVRIELPKLPRMVKFVITASLTDVPASELLRELERKGAVGLVTRIEALKEKGVIKKP